MSIFSHVILIILAPYRLKFHFFPLWCAPAVSHKMSHRNHNKIYWGRSVPTLWRCKWPPAVCHLRRIGWQASSNSSAGSCCVTGFWSRGKLIARLTITEQPQQNYTCQGCASVTSQPSFQLTNHSAGGVYNTVDSSFQGHCPEWERCEMTSRESAWGVDSSFTNNYPQFTEIRRLCCSFLVAD